MATMQEVAVHAGVSIATVSFVVNNTKKVSPATRERVQASMAALGFRNNAIARALASKRTRIIALLVPSVEHRMRVTALEFFTAPRHAPPTSATTSCSGRSRPPATT